MDPDKLSRIARRAHLLELALAGMESFAGDSTPADPEQYFSPVRELAEEVATALYGGAAGRAEAGAGGGGTMSARPPRTFVTQQDVADARHDIDVKDQGSAFLLVPKTRRARRWLRTWPTTAVEPHRMADVVAEARVAGLAVRL